MPTGAVQLQLQRTGTTLKAANIAGLTYSAGDKLQVRLQVVGTSPTTIRSKVWKAGTTEPSAWQLTTTDSTASLQGAGSVGLSTYIAGSATTVPLTTTFDDYSVQPSGSTTTPPVNVPPIASFTSSVNNLGASFDGSGSTDSDGTLASYSWDFGDSSTGTGASTSHTYASAGTYSVGLTVTDNSGASNTATKSVTVTAPPITGAAFMTDAFGRTVVNGLGSADLGGTWTLKGSAANFSVGSGVGVLKSTAAGQTFEAYLGAVSSTDTDIQVVATPQQAITGTAAYISLIGRRIGTVDYRARAAIDPTGKVVIQIQENGVTMKAVTVAGLSYSPGDSLQMRLQVFGTSPTTVQARVWKVGTIEPTTWQVSTTDSTSGLQAAGSVGVGTYLAASATVLPFAVTFDNLTASKH
jgi:PKD repeat protein